MPLQELSLYGGLHNDHLERATHLLQTLTTRELTEFKTYTEVFNDTSEVQGRRAANFIHFRKVDEVWSLNTFETPEMAKRPVGARVQYSSTINEGDHRALAKSIGMSLAYAYFEQGYSIRIGTLLVTIYRIFKVVPNELGEVSHESEGLAIGSGATWIIKASMSCKVEAQQQLKLGTEELLRLKKILADTVEMQVITDELR